MNALTRISVAASLLGLALAAAAAGPFEQCRYTVRSGAQEVRVPLNHVFDFCGPNGAKLVVLKSDADKNGWMLYQDRHSSRVSLLGSGAAKTASMLVRVGDEGVSELKILAGEKDAH